MTGVDDPRQILAESGVECADLDAFYAHDWMANEDGVQAAILALARLVAKYKWQRDIQIGNEYHDGNEYMAVTDEDDVAYVIADLDRRWAESQSK